MLCFLPDDLVNLVKISRFRDVTENSVAPLCNRQAHPAHTRLSEGCPHGLGLWRQRQLLENIDRLCKLLAIQTSAEVDQRFVQLILHCAGPFVYDHKRSPAAALDLFDVALDLMNSHAIG